MLYPRGLYKHAFQRVEPIVIEHFVKPDKRTAGLLGAGILGALLRAAIYTIPPAIAYYHIQKKLNAQNPGRRTKTSFGLSRRKRW